MFTREALTRMGAPVAEHASIATSHGEVSAVVTGPREAGLVIVLAHGAGGDMTSPFMTRVAEDLGERGRCVWRFNFPYAQAGRRSPDRQPILEGAFGDVARHLAGGGAGLVLGGKSLGGRIASHVVANGFDARGLVFLGYPLHPPGRPERLRGDHLAGIRVPMLFVEGRGIPSARSKLWNACSATFRPLPRSQ